MPASMLGFLVYVFQYGKPYPLSISSRTSFFSLITENHIRSLYLPVLVFHFFQYGKPYSISISSHTRFSVLLVWETIFALNILPYPFFISSRTGNCTTRIKVFSVRETVDIIIYLPVPVFHFFLYGSPYSLSISSRIRFSFFPVRETIFALNIFPYPFFISSRTGTRTRI